MERRRRPNNFGLKVIILERKVILQAEPQKAPSPKQQLSSAANIEDLDLDPDTYISQVLEIFKHFGQYYS